MQFYEIAKYLRQENGLSQKQLGEKIGISPAAIGHLELRKHEPNSTTLLAYSKFFHVSTDYLLGRTDDFGAVPVVPTAPQQLSKNDRELIEAYHTLSPDLQRLLWEQIRLWQRNADAMSAGTKKKA